MIRGRVSRNLQPRVVVEVMGSRGQFQSIEAVMDTGFNHDLTLPSEVIRHLRLTTEGGWEAFLANGEEVTLNGWRGIALWHGQPRRILVLQADGEPLPGMGLLLGSRVTMDALPGGDVTIDELLPEPTGG